MLKSFELPFQLQNTISRQLVVALTLCVFTAAVYRRLRSSQIKIPKGLKLPPGPPGRFLIGNLLDLPTKENWKTFHRWAQTYGDFTYLNIFGTSFLFVNSYKIQNELFEKRGAIYSDRFQSTMLHDLSGFDWSVASLQYDDLWRRHRGVLHNVLNKVAFVKHRATVESHARELLLQLYESPSKFLEHSRHALGAFTLDMTYGYKVQKENDPYVETAESAARLIGRVSQPGAFYVDVLPILKYVPSWFPGAGFKHTARTLNKHLQNMIHIPFNNVKELMKEGKASPSVVSNILEDIQTRQESVNYKAEEEILRNIGGVMYLAGIDTTESSFQSFFMAMILYPEVQQAAQKELDNVIGSKALPTFEDRDNLPYIDALVKETLRWRPVAPCGFPHMLREDDVVGDYFIPKGTIVMGNIWALLHSPSYGEEVDDFNPARFLKGDPNVKDPDVAFGFGRRVCPGKVMADSELFMFLASILHVFEISPHETEIPKKDDYISSVISLPKPFKCRLRPRNPETKVLLEQLSHDHD